MLVGGVAPAVDDPGTAGPLSIQLGLKPAKDGGLEKTLTCDFSTAIPRHALPDSVFFSTGDGDLVRTDPDQREMFAGVSAGTSRPTDEAQAG